MLLTDPAASSILRYVQPRTAGLGPKPPKLWTKPTTPIPARWLRLLLPRRDRPSGELEVPEVDPDRGRDYILAVREQHGTWFDELHGRSDLPDSLRAALHEPIELSNPVAAGIEVAQGIGTVHPGDLLGTIGNIVDWWISERGVTFAINAATHVRHWCAAVISEHALDYNDRGRATIGRVVRGYGTNTTVADLALIRLRRHLATLPEHQWTAAAAAAEESRTLDNPGSGDDHAERQRIKDNIEHNVRMTFLFPTMRAWVDQEVATITKTHQVWRRYRCHEVPKLSSALYEISQLDVLETHWFAFGEDRDSGAQLAGDPLPTLLDLFGTDLIPWLHERLRAVDDTGRSIKMLKKVSEDHAKALGLLDTDGALLALHELSDTTPAARREFSRVQKDQPDRVAALLDPDAANADTTADELPIGETPSALGQVAGAKLPFFLSVDQCPPVLLPGRHQALSSSAMQQLLSLLATSSLENPDPAIPAAAAELDPISLHGLLRFLFEAWNANGLDADHRWILDTLGLLGDDDTVRWLGPVIRELPGRGFAKRAMHGVDALATIGTARAFAEISAIAEAAKRLKTLRTHARKLIQEIANNRGFSPDELTDFLVPDLGLGTEMTFDYGPRAVTVEFDEFLNPVILDVSGKRRKQMPRVSKADDQELAATSAARFRAIKRDVQKIGTTQIVRLERAMVTKRIWTTDMFNELLVCHPLLVQLVRRLVWAADSGEPTEAATTFRLAEDGKLEDLADQQIALLPESPVWVAHPARMGRETTAQWATIFEDHEISQPFEQLDRQVYLPSEDDHDSSRLTQFEGRAQKPAQLLKLLDKGWELTPDRGRLQRELPDGRHFSILLDPPYLSSNAPRIQVAEVAISDGTFATADARCFSELVADLSALAS